MVRHHSYFDSPLLEHDAMYMLQNIEKARHKQLERKAREDRRRSLAAQTGRSAEEIKARELEIASARNKAATAEMKEKAAAEKAEEAEKPEDKAASKIKARPEEKPKSAKAKRPRKKTVMTSLILMKKMKIYFDRIDECCRQINNFAVI